MELVLADDLFPASLPPEERVRHWMALFSFFTLPHCKALNSILAQKQRYRVLLLCKHVMWFPFLMNLFTVSRFQREMRTYLALREMGKVVLPISKCVQ